jgi:dTDP-4-amino-4,6-dideoxygalactose transaminase
MTTGEGGMIVSRVEDLIERCKLTRFHGIDRDPFERSALDLLKGRYDVVAPGFKYNMTDIAAALGRTQLVRVREFHARRQCIATRYQEELAGIPLTLPAWPKSDQTHSWHLYPVQLEDRLSRDEFIEHLTRNGVGFSMHYRPLHQMTYWRTRYHLSDDQFPIATRYAERCVSLPIFASMRDDEVSRVIDVVHAAFD